MMHIHMLAQKSLYYILSTLPPCLLPALCSSTFFSLPSLPFDSSAYYWSFPQSRKSHTFPPETTSGGWGERRMDEQSPAEGGFDQLRCWPLLLRDEGCEGASEGWGKDVGGQKRPSGVSI